MKKTSGGLILFFASIFVGLLIAFNINFSKIFESPLRFNAKEYQNAIAERNDLYKEITNLKSRNKDIQDTINKYKYDDKKQDNILDSMKNQFKDYGMITGNTEVQGPGILLKINDGNIDLSKDTEFETKSKIFHDNDMALVINDLRKAGAEAIAINNHRVMPNSGVICNWAFLGFEDETTEYAPFYIYAIGDPDTLEAALYEDGSHVRELMIRELSVKVEKKDNILMPAASKFSSSNYMKEYTEK
ncbi:DUF881 domain-containing protein [Clostridium baratii]|uniref:Division initiation protein n=1 Tax=Clostridium baratii str. Sullivan TaxID=1415775 RepID=A0A0A7FZ84_9CLOT|nr:DUF881 domain-containing protein [Clostridium baratii]AIY84929.1 hypothetical protein U729_2865 [Clostridium baratii str. Sullivan]MDU1053652.1 DUF881 domain-containing protein [Clostridium baratii]MDU4910304.1 DUF881 domain-containing protein [Clostridium baratii]CUO98057.1 division initiation protein [Clostridium baratii]